MTDQSETSTANNTVERQLCKMGCGFFGSNATGDCCSKCWGEQQRRQGLTAKKPPAATVESPTDATCGIACSNSIDVSTSSDTAQIDRKADQIISNTTASMKKKKNMSYKALMAGITSGSGASQDMNKQREKIRSVTGGGTFTKIDKI